LVYYSHIECNIKELFMQDEKKKKIIDDFSLLNEEQQDYILGIMQALVFANKTNQPGHEKTGANTSAPESQVL